MYIFTIIITCFVIFVLLFFSLRILPLFLKTCVAILPPSAG